MNDDLESRTTITCEWFRAPEVFEASCGYTGAVDIWSLGIVFLFLVTGKMPTNKNAGKRVLRMETILETCLKNCPEEPKNIIADMLRTSPEKRLGANELLAKYFGAEILKPVAAPSSKMYAPYAQSTVKNIETLDLAYPKVRMGLQYRKILLDWLERVANRERCSPTTLFATLVALDEYVQPECDYHDFQKIACACLYICSHYYELDGICEDQLAYYTANSVSKNDLLAASRDIYCRLGPSFFTRLELRDAIEYKRMQLDASRWLEVSSGWQVIAKNIADPKWFEGKKLLDIVVSI